ncbi:homeobox-DDT domain protein RLT3 isoform X2 [Nymphaea colorata]|uniref:homeobox-DDT domain protein RLT3 isoform X2 n=1 Tax=Nymphaea colorata TaxID=210225 RepID=UPI00214E392F|nr:homeobox-DDT domain protein RLT3 isoform X2 [Nymphaea colorata]
MKPLWKGALDTTREYGGNALGNWRAMPPTENLRSFVFYIVMLMLLTLPPSHWMSLLKRLSTRLIEFGFQDSLLLGEIHMSLLSLLLTSVVNELQNGALSLASKDCQFYAFLQFVKQQESDIMLWKKYLNPLSWPEILRQVMLAAGYGSKKSSLLQVQKDNHKEQNQLLKLGLQRGTLKGELFHILQEQGCSGMKVCELVKACQITEMDLPKSAHELEESIRSALSRDIKLFEKISACAFRIRFNPSSQATEQLESDSEDAGSVENNSIGSEGDDAESDEPEELDSATDKFGMVGHISQSRITGKWIIDNSEIDESQPGEAWMLGLQEGDYGNLTIEEKLDALVALVDLTNAAFSMRAEKSVRDKLQGPPSIWVHGSGAKIKKSYQSLSPTPFQQHCNKSLMVEAGSSQKRCPDFGFPSKHMSDKMKARKRKTVERYGSNKHWMQSVYLGSDRRYNSYWLFLGACDSKDPGHRRVYFESSEDGHWEVIDTDKGLDALLSSLDSRGFREAQLLASLETRLASLRRAMLDDLSAENENKLVKSATAVTSESGSSPLSDVDNNLDVTHSFDDGTGLLAPHCRMDNVGHTSRQKEATSDHRQSFDAWVWKNFYYKLGSLKYKRSTKLESLARCERCNDLYWRDEKHCIICHTTFELDFDIEERYIVHVATCRGIGDGDTFLHHKVLSSDLQSLKAAAHAIEAVMPEESLLSAWSRSGHALWVKRLRRTSSLPELLQVLTDFVDAMNNEWFFQLGLDLGSRTAFNEIVIFFNSIPRTVSAVALWLVKLDHLLTCYLEQVQPQKPAGGR